MAPNIARRNLDHISHIWPMLPLERDLAILPCEQICQWCPLSKEKRWETAAALRKHARCHLKDSPFTILSAGAGGRKPLADQALYINPRQIYEAHLRSAAEIDAAHGVHHRVLPQSEEQTPQLFVSRTAKEMTEDGATTILAPASTLQLVSSSGSGFPLLGSLSSSQPEMVANQSVLEPPHSARRSSTIVVDAEESSPGEGSTDQPVAEESASPIKKKARATRKLGGRRL